MTLLEQISNPYLASLVLGVFYGFTFCTSICLPYISSYIAGISAGFRKGVKVTAIYNSGRIAAYAVIGILTALFKALISDSLFGAYQKYSSLAFGVAVVAIGISIFFTKHSDDHCAMKKIKQEPQGVLDTVKQRFDARAFSMGFTRGFVLCPPLVALLLFGVTSSPQTNPAFLAILFGIGTAASPLLFLGGMTGWLLEKAPLLRKWISRFGGATLILLGISVLISAIIEFL
jgi:sulfite exporter TauE/SafE